MWFGPRMTAPFCGIIAGIEGAIHGIGEIRQGDARPSGLVFDSWVNGPIAEKMEGEPALSLVPHLGLTGILAMTVSVVLVSWSVAPMPLRSRGFGQGTLAGVLLLVGGGIAPPLIAALGGWSAIALARNEARGVTRRPHGCTRLLGRTWTALFLAMVFAGSFLFLASLAVMAGLPLDAPGLFVAFFLAQFVLVALAIPAGVGYETAHPSLPASGANKRVESS